MIDLAQQGVIQMTDQIENPMIKNCLWPEPCRFKAPPFRAFIEEEFSLAYLLGDPQIMEILIDKYYDDYQTWLREIS